MKKQLLGAVAALAMTAGVAQAGWTGCNVGISVGMGYVNSEVDVDRTASDGWQFGLGAGCDVELAQRFVFGVFGDYTFQDLEHKDTLTLGGLNATLDAGMGDMWTIGGRAGFLVTPTTLVYGLLGYTRAEMDDVSIVTNVGSNLGMNFGDVNGMTLGGGMESMLTPNVSLKLEYRYTDLDSVSSPIPLVGGSTVNVDSELHSVRVGLAYHFNFLGGLPEQLK